MKRKHKYISLKEYVRFKTMQKEKQISDNLIKIIAKWFEVPVSRLKKQDRIYKVVATNATSFVIEKVN